MHVSTNVVVFIAFYVFIVLMVAVESRMIFVSPNDAGDDTTCALIALDAPPCRTVAGAVAAALDNDTIVLMEGIHEFSRSVKINKSLSIVPDKQAKEKILLQPAAQGLEGCERCAATDFSYKCHLIAVDTEVDNYPLTVSLGSSEEGAPPLYVDLQGRNFGWFWHRGLETHGVVYPENIVRISNIVMSQFRDATCSVAYFKGGRITLERLMFKDGIYPHLGVSALYFAKLSEESSISVNGLTFVDVQSYACLLHAGNIPKIDIRDITCLDCVGSICVIDSVSTDIQHVTVRGDTGLSFFLEYVHTLLLENVTIDGASYTKGYAKQPILLTGNKMVTVISLTLRNITTGNDENDAEGQFPRALIQSHHNHYISYRPVHIYGSRRAQLIDSRNDGTIEVLLGTLQDGLAEVGDGGCLSIRSARLVTLVGSIFSACVSKNSGGAVFMDSVLYDDSTVLNIDQSQFMGNTAAENGGAIAVSNVNVHDFFRNRFEFNQATRGGAISLHNAVWMRGMVFDETIFSIFANNTAQGDGGAIHVSHDMKIRTPSSPFASWKGICQDNVAGTVGSCVSIAQGASPWLIEAFNISAACCMRNNRAALSPVDQPIATHAVRVLAYLNDRLIEAGDLIEISPSQPLELRFVPLDAFGALAFGSDANLLNLFLQPGSAETRKATLLYGESTHNFEFENTPIGSVVNVSLSSRGLYFASDAQLQFPTLRFHIIDCPMLHYSDYDNRRCVSYAHIFYPTLVAASLCCAFFVALVFALGAALYQFIKRRKQAMIVKRLMASGSSGGTGSINGYIRLDTETQIDDQTALLLQSLPDGMIIKREDVSILDAIGGGAQGVMFSAMLHGSTPIALKLFPTQSLIEGEKHESLTDFANEMAMLHRFGNHANIVRMYGVVDYGNKIGIATELMRGSLASYIQRMTIGRGHGDSTWTIGLDIKLRILAGVAAGLAYLHSHDVMHRDIKPANVLVNDGEWDRAMLCDFGMSRVRGNTLRAQTMTIGTFDFMAPEVIGGDFDYTGTGSSSANITNIRYTSAIDVYSFGILACCLIIETIHPFEENAMGSDISLLFSVKNQGLRPPMDDQELYRQCEAHCKRHLHLSTAASNEWIIALSKMLFLIRQCWAQDPEQRPTMVQVLTELVALKSKVVQ